MARYFQAFDAEDLPAILDTLGEGCVFTVETHGVRLEGREAISDMLRRLWTNHRAFTWQDRIRWMRTDEE